jgi:hypothetical protein
MADALGTSRSTRRTLCIINKKASYRCRTNAVPDKTALLFAKFMFGKICFLKDELRQRNNACSL